MKADKAKPQSGNANVLAVKRGDAKKTKAGKDPNKPKRPPSAFFVFMEEFREQYKKAHPENKQVSVVGKAGGLKWKSLTAEEKAPYMEIADKRKVEYEKKMDRYNKGIVGGKEDSDKSKSEVNDEDDEDGSDEE